MNKASHLANQLIRAVSRPTKNPRTGKVRRTTFFRLPAGLARQAGVRGGSTFKMTVASDGTITLSPVSTIDAKRQQELLSALEKTEEQFGEALRRLAQ